MTTPPVRHDVLLTLIRHGQSIWNAEKRYQGQDGPGLSELGQQQAKHAAAYLDQEFPAFDRVLASDLPRVQETAQPWSELAGRTPIVDPAWRECDTGAWNGLFREQVAERFADELVAFRRGEDIPRGGGETFAGFRQRCAQALDELVRSSATDDTDPVRVLVFTHGGCIEMCAAEALGLPPMKHVWLRSVTNCSVTTLGCQVDDGRFAAAELLDYNRNTQPIE